MKSLWVWVALFCPAFGFAATPTTSADVGAVGVGGATTLANSIYTVRASGEDVWGSRDEFRFVYGSLSGDGEIIARVDSLAAADAWTKAGVMIRESLDANSRFAFALVSGSNGADFQYRQSAGGLAGLSGTNDRVTRAPSWLRLRRAGNVFTAFISTDGTNWTQRGGSATIAMSATAFVGIALTSHNDGALATAVFSRVSYSGSQTTPPTTPPPVTPPPVTPPPVTPPPTTPPPSGVTFTSVDIGAVGAAGSLTAANGVYTVRASGADIWDSQDEFRFVYTSLSGDGEVTARVDSLAAADAWTKAGVMIRESLAANSRFAYSMLSGSNGADFEYRQATGGSAGPSGTYDRVTKAPYWVRLRRVGNVFTAYISANGTAWTQRGSSATIAMGTSVFVGLAVTSHSDGAIATAVFSNVKTGGVTTTPPTTPPPVTPPPATTGSATLSWSPPTTNTNGSALTDLVAFKVYWGTSPGVYSNTLVINNPSTRSWTINNLAGGRRWYFTVSALTVAGTESGKSNEANKLLP